MSKKQYIEIRSQYNFPPIKVLAEWRTSYWLISRRSLRKIPSNQGYYHTALTPYGYRDHGNKTSPVITP